MMEDWKSIFQKETNCKLKLGLDKLKIGNITVGNQARMQVKWKKVTKKSVKKFTSAK